MYLAHSGVLVDICDPETSEVFGEGHILTPNRVTGEYYYPTNLDCSLSISREGLDSSGASTGSVKLVFELFDVEQEDAEICYDKLLVDDQEFCAGRSSQEYCWNKPRVEVRFQSDDFAATAELFTGFYILFQTADYNMCACTTVKNSDGSGGQACVFPFQFEGVTYHQCGGTHTPFCATSVDQNGIE